MTNLERFRAKFSELSADAALISSETNQRYLSDFSYTDGYIVVTETEAFLLTDSRYIEAARASVRDFEVILATGGMRETLKKLLTDKKISTLATEDGTLSHLDFCELSELLSGISLVGGASALIGKLRAVKTDAEIARIEAAQKITDAAFLHILDFINPNRTEREVALELEFFMRKMGAESVAFDTIAVSGPSSSLPHGVPADIKLRRGFFTMDFGAKFDGYCSDMTRTVCIGKADEEMKRLYDTVLSAQTAALSGMRAGMLCRDVDALARDVIREAGYGEYFGHGLGHGVGMFIHEAPSVSPRAGEGVILEAGNVVTVEPGIYLEGRYGCRIEDMVVILENGLPYNFTKSDKRLIEL